MDGEGKTIVFIRVLTVALRYRFCELRALRTDERGEMSYPTPLEGRHCQIRRLNSCAQ